MSTFCERSERETHFSSDFILAIAVPGSATADSRRPRSDAPDSPAGRRCRWRRQPWRWHRPSALGAGKKHQLCNLHGIWPFILNVFYFILFWSVLAQHRLQIHLFIFARSDPLPAERHQAVTGGGQLTFSPQTFTTKQAVLLLGSCLFSRGM